MVYSSVVPPSQWGMYSAQRIKKSAECVPYDESNTKMDVHQAGCRNLDNVEHKPKRMTVRGLENLPSNDFLGADESMVFANEPF